MKTKLRLQQKKERDILWQNNPLRKKRMPPKDEPKKTADFFVAFNFKFKKGLVPIEIVKSLEWSPLQGRRLMEKRSSLPTRRNQHRSKGFLSQDEVVEILDRDYGITFTRQALTYLEKGDDVTSVKPQMILALCEIMGLSLEELYVD